MVVMLDRGLRLVAIGLLAGAGALAVLGVGYFVPSRPEISLVARRRRAACSG